MVTRITLKFLSSNSHRFQITRMQMIYPPAQNSDVKYLIIEKATFSAGLKSTGRLYTEIIMSLRGLI